jgi:hypothetical protein
LHSGDVLRVIMRVMTVQRWPDTQEKLEGVAEIVSVVAVESVRAIVNGELPADCRLNSAGLISAGLFSSIAVCPLLRTK